MKAKTIILIIIFFLIKCNNNNKDENFRSYIMNDFLIAKMHYHIYTMDDFQLVKNDAKKNNKKIFIIFTYLGTSRDYRCMFENDSIFKFLNDYIFIASYNDDRRFLSDSNFISSNNLSNLKTKGDYNKYIQDSLLHDLSYPMIGLFDNNCKLLDTIKDLTCEKILIILKKNK